MIEVFQCLLVEIGLLLKIGSKVGEQYRLPVELIDGNLGNRCFEQQYLVNE